MTAAQAATLVQQFEQCSLPKEAWTHEAHFIMAFFYCMQHPVCKATEMISEGIKKYNLSVGGSNTDTSGYHETITLFYSSTVCNYIICNRINSINDNSIKALLAQSFIKKDYLNHFYTKEQIDSVSARKHWEKPGINGAGFF